jgi:uncharacterized protein (DUF1330 family)
MTGFEPGAGERHRILMRAAGRGVATTTIAYYRHTPHVLPTELPMPKGYWVTCYRSISDPDKLAAYAKLAPPAVESFGGRYLARGIAGAVYEAGQKERIVISEFPSYEKAVAAHDGPAYQAALKALGDGAVRDIRIIEGLE